MVEQFCKAILQLIQRNGKALANLVMGLASQTSAKSVVEVSLSPCFHFQYSSINKAIDSVYSEKEAKKGGQAGDATERLDAEKNFVCQNEVFPQTLWAVLAN